MLLEGTAAVAVVLEDALEDFNDRCRFFEAHKVVGGKQKLGLVDLFGTKQRKSLVFECCSFIDGFIADLDRNACFQQGGINVLFRTEECRDKCDGEEVVWKKVRGVGEFDKTV